MDFANHQRDTTRKEDCFSPIHAEDPGWNYEKVQVVKDEDNQISLTLSNHSCYSEYFINSRREDSLEN